MVEDKKKSVWDTINDYYTNKCPNCKSDDIEGLNLYRGHYKKKNPLGLKNKRKWKCNTCNYEWWEDEGVL